MAGPKLRQTLNRLKATTPTDETLSHFLVILHNTQEGAPVLYLRCSGQNWQQGRTFHNERLETGRQLTSGSEDL